MLAPLLVPLGKLFTALGGFFIYGLGTEVKIPALQNSYKDQRANVLCEQGSSLHMLLPNILGPHIVTWTNYLISLYFVFIVYKRG